MENNYLRVLFVIVFFIASPAKSQVSELVTELGYPAAVGVHDNYLYTNDYGTVLRLDLSVNDPIPEQVFGQGSGVALGAIIFDDCTMYVAAPGPWSIETADICIPDTELTSLFYPTTSPKNIAVLDEFMYIIYSSSTWCGYLMDTVERVNINDPAGFEVVVSGLGCITSLAIHGTDLFLADQWNNNIVKIDLTDDIPSPEVFISAIDYPSALTVVGDLLYVGSWSEKVIYRIDVTAINPQLEYVTWLCCAPSNLVEHDNFLYVAQPFAGKVSKVDLSNLSIDEVGNSPIILYPNPSGDFIKIKGISTEQNYQLLNIAGITVQEGAIQSENKIDIRNLQSGIYFVRFARGTTLKFIKK